VDEADRADEQAEQTLRAALLRRLPAGPAATGECLWCGERLTGIPSDLPALRATYRHSEPVSLPVSPKLPAFRTGSVEPPSRRFCNRECRDDWERANAPR
jgi:hypothetical protein